MFQITFGLTSGLSNIYSPKERVFRFNILDNVMDESKVCDKLLYRIRKLFTKTKKEVSTCIRFPYSITLRLIQNSK